MTIWKTFQCILDLLHWHWSWCGLHQWLGNWLSVLACVYLYTFEKHSSAFWFVALTLFMMLSLLTRELHYKNRLPAFKHIMKTISCHCTKTVDEEMQDLIIRQAEKYFWALDLLHWYFMMWSSLMSLKAVNLSWPFSTYDKFEKRSSASLICCSDTVHIINLMMWSSLIEKEVTRTDFQLSSPSGDNRITKILGTY